MFKRILTCIVILVCAMLLFACFNITDIYGDDTNNNDVLPPEDDYEEPTFLDLNQLNYNSNYTNPENPSEKGFIIYDSIKFNALSYTIRSKRQPRFTIFYEEELVKLIEKSTSGTEYPSYTFFDTGKYKIEVNGDGGVMGYFFVNVRGCGYPDKVITYITDLNGNKVTKIQAGESYKQQAEVYSDGVLLPNDTDLYNSGWSNGSDGSRIKEFRAPNTVKDGEYIKSYRCTYNLPKDTRAKSTLLSVPIINNHKGIEVIDYGDLKNHDEHYNALLNLSEHPGDRETEPTNFMQRLRFQHVFTNGEREDINVFFTGQLQGKSNIILGRIKTDDEAEIYNRDNYNIEDPYNPPPRELNQFPLGIDKVTLYFEYCYLGEDNRREYERFDDIVFTITILP